ncbi:Leucine-rich repeat receptor protein kinase EMS1 [Linum perenne]
MAISLPQASTMAKALNFLSLAVFFFTVCSSNPELETLLSFKSSLQNPKSLSSWNESLPFCNWVGITCRLGRVSSLELTSASLSGEIPPQLGELTHLRTLKLGFNSLTGNLPPEIGNLTSLVTLDLSGNGLEGKLPVEIGKLTRLKFLDLNSNFFSGEIPGEIFNNFRELTSVDISNNSLSGEIPPEIGNLTNLIELYIGTNSFSGGIPPEIGSLTRLQVFISRSCSISGPLPDAIGNLISLRHLDISHNPLRCKIPKSIGKLKNLIELDLSFSEMNGTIPRELGHCKSLKMLTLSFNSLTGAFPEELSNLPLVSFSAEKNHFSGQLPAWIGKWNSITSILLAGNRFEGPIPKQIGNCSSLQRLNLNDNLLAGEIPEEICGGVSLQEIGLRKNLLTGRIDNNGVFSKCRNLTQLVLDGNRLTGSIPGYFADLENLMVLDLDSNGFSGPIPVRIWDSSSLMEFSAGRNKLEGSLPAEIGNAVVLETLVLNDNRISGSIPKEIGNLSALSLLNLNSNLLEGSIPVEIGKCGSLTMLDLGNNSLTGSIPDELANLSELQSLVLSHNGLSGSIPGKPSSYFRQVNVPDLGYLQHRGVLDLSNNKLSGPIPSELGNLVVLVNLLLQGNMLDGEIPSSLANLTSLATLDLGSNRLAGSIPVEFGRCSNLQGLYLANNHLSGTVPDALGGLSSLVKLNLTGNDLRGSLPSSFSNLKQLSHMDISYNKLESELPSSLSEMSNLVGLFLQGNRISGSLDMVLSNAATWRVEAVNLSDNLINGGLPSSIGNLSFLSSLDLHRNSLSGTIPVEMRNLLQLEYLDLSGNRLFGEIPESLCILSSLNHLNLSGNELEGPETGICLNLSGISPPSCPYCLIRRWEPWQLSGVVIGFAIFTIVIAFYLRRWVFVATGNSDEIEDSTKLKKLIDHHRNLYFMNHSMIRSSSTREPLSINLATFQQPLLKVTLSNILEGTNNFCNSNIIGDGGFGTVYKAKLVTKKNDILVVAVKKLSHSKAQGDREFMAEMETLGKVKHKNLVSLLGYCSLGEEKLLVYEYMANGSLDTWLRDGLNPKPLDWATRLKIAIGSARGLAFLHHGFTPHVIHRDVKSSNILLDADFEAKVADFGLARLISAYETHVSTEIAGTLGYIPPEYGQSGRASVKGDVYSYGVILLELVTGKEPTGPEFKEGEGGNLVGWVLQKVKKGEGVDVVDQSVVNGGGRLGVMMMMKVLEVAVGCLAEKPNDRPSMRQVLEGLKGIRGVRSDADGGEDTPARKFGGGIDFSAIWFWREDDCESGRVGYWVFEQSEDPGKANRFTGGKRILAAGEKKKKNRAAEGKNGGETELCLIK